MMMEIRIEMELLHNSIASVFDSYSGPTDRGYRDAIIMEGSIASGSRK